MVTQTQSFEASGSRSNRPVTSLPKDRGRSPFSAGFVQCDKIFAISGDCSGFRSGAVSLRLCRCRLLPVLVADMRTNDCPLKVDGDDLWVSNRLSC